MLNLGCRTHKYAGQTESRSSIHSFIAVKVHDQRYIIIGPLLILMVGIMRWGVENKISSITTKVNLYSN
jgi:hypothetical protein